VRATSERREPDRSSDEVEGGRVLKPWWAFRLLGVLHLGSEMWSARDVRWKAPLQLSNCPSELVDLPFRQLVSSFEQVVHEGDDLGQRQILLPEFVSAVIVLISLFVILAAKRSCFHLLQLVG